MKADSLRSVSSAAPPGRPPGFHPPHPEGSAPTRTSARPYQFGHRLQIQRWTWCQGRIVFLGLTTLLTAPISHMLSASRPHTSSCPQWAAACRGVHPSVSLLSTSTPHCRRTLTETGSKRCHNEPNANGADLKTAGAHLMTSM